MLSLLIKTETSRKYTCITNFRYSRQLQITMKHPSISYFTTLYRAFWYNIHSTIAKVSICESINGEPLGCLWWSSSNFSPFCPWNSYSGIWFQYSHQRRNKTCHIPRASFYHLFWILMWKRIRQQELGHAKCIQILHKEIEKNCSCILTLIFYFTVLQTCDRRK